MQSEEEALAEHARECTTCGEWLASQRFLGAALQSLRTETAAREAGSKVENALLSAFHDIDFEPAASETPDVAAPAAWRLSRYFETGAYVAVAAALLVGVFLGSRVLRDRHMNSVQTQAHRIAPPAQNVPVKEAPAESPRLEVAKVTGKLAHTTATAGQSLNGQAVKADDNEGYVALMLCDPLICSGEEQVIRMELPGTGSSPVLADVVVGEDGLVRAMRIVNQ